MDKNKIINVLNNHGTIAFPTETVMGLGILYDDYDAYLYLNKTKRRPEDKPYTMMLSKTSEIEKYAVVDEKAKRLIEAFMPGPVTLLLNAKSNVPNYVTHDTKIIGVRVPNMPEILEMLSSIDKPLLVPSANRSGEKPASNSEEVKSIFKEEVGYVVDGESGHQSPSTIIDLTCEKYKILREGPIKETDIIKALGDLTISKSREK